jgi:transcriptional regulator with XRE-family HTH domain
MGHEARDKVFGANLRRLRKDAGFESQEALARALDVSVFTISRYERGETKPDINGLYALAQVLGVEASELLPNAEQAA